MITTKSVIDCGAETIKTSCIILLIMITFGDCKASDVAIVCNIVERISFNDSESIKIGRLAAININQRIRVDSGNNG